MTGSIRGVGLAIGLLTLTSATLVWAQENLQAGMTGAQLYAADCAICHKSPRALNRSTTVFGLESFISEHYTASRESAAKITAYLRKVAMKPAPSRRRRAVDRPTEGARRVKSIEKKKAEEQKKVGKPAEAKTGNLNPAEVETAKARSTKTKEHVTKPTTEKPGTSKSSLAGALKSKSSESKSGEANTAKSGAAEAKTSKTKMNRAKAKEERNQAKAGKPKTDNGKTGEVHARKLKLDTTDKEESAD